MNSISYFIQLTYLKCVYFYNYLRLQRRIRLSKKLEAEKLALYKELDRISMKCPYCKEYMIRSIHDDDDREWFICLKCNVELIKQEKK